MNIRSRVGAAISVLLLVWACADHEGGTTDADRDAEVVRLLTWKPNQPRVWDELLAAFERENPDLSLAREVGPHSSTAFHDMLIQKLKNRSRDLDVFLMDVIWPPEFGAAGWAEPLDARLSASEREAFFEGAILANTYNEQLFGVPLYVDSGMLYYRKDLLDRYELEPPETWSELVEQAKTIVAGESREGREMVGYSGQFKQYEGLVCDMLEFVLGNGGRLIDPASGRSALHTPPTLEAVRFVRHQLIGPVAPRGVLTYQEPESLDLFIQGRAIFHRNWPYAWEVSNDPERSQVVDKVAIAPLPHFEDGESHATLGGWQVGISRYSEKKEAAWRLVHYLTGEQAQKKLAIDAGLAPARKSLYDDPEVLRAHPHLGSMRDVFATAHPRPRTPLYPAISNVLQRYFSTVLSDESADVEREASRAGDEIDRLLALAEDNAS